MDYTAIVAAADFTPTLAAISGIAAAIMVALVGLASWRFARRAVTS